MKDFVEKMREVSESLVKSKGPMVFFALIGREGSLGLWDVVIAADWLGEDRSTPRKYVIRKIQKTLTKAEMLMISRVILLRPDEPFVLAFTNWLDMRDSPCAVLVSSVVGGISIERAYVFSRQDLSHKEAV